MQEQIKKGVVLKDNRFEDETLYILVTSNKVKPSGKKGFLIIKGIVLESTDKAYIGISVINIEIVKTEVFAENLLEYYKKIELAQFTELLELSKNTLVKKRPRVVISEQDYKKTTSKSEELSNLEELTSLTEEIKQEDMLGFSQKILRSIFPPEMFK